MKKLTFYVYIILAVFYLSSCNSRLQHKDTFYNDLGDFPYLRLPLIKPYYVDRADSNSPWTLYLRGFLWVSPQPHFVYGYDVKDLRKLSVENGIIMAYSPYVDEQADQSIRDNYYHWFVIIPDRKIEAGFGNEGAFIEYVQKYGVQQPDWRTPIDIFNNFQKTGCMDWIPGCK
jgi:hypothetical protein